MYHEWKLCTYVSVRLEASIKQERSELILKPLGAGKIYRLIRIETETETTC